LATDNAKDCFLRWALAKVTAVVTPTDSTGRNRSVGIAEGVPKIASRHHPYHETIGYRLPNFQPIPELVP
jgi:hypothetical protein